MQSAFYPRVDLKGKKNTKKKASDNFAFRLNQELVFTDVRWWYQIMDSVNSIDNIDE